MKKNTEQIVFDFIKENNLLESGEAVLAAVSGGADSICMLSILNKYCKEYGNRIGVVHVNHGFRQEAAYEATFVQSYCDSLGIPFFLKEIEPGACKQSEEEARLYRYKLIDEVLRDEGFHKIALAHNSQDRAEKMLFNLFRGTGITGLSSIKPKRDCFIRPVLILDRSQIENYLYENDISHVVDASNNGDAYDRNKIRHHIIPRAVEINDAAIKHMYEAADRLALIDEYITNQAKNAYDKYIHVNQNGKEIFVEELLGIDKVVRQIVIRQILSDMSPNLKDITSDHIEAVEKICEIDGNGRINLPYGICVYKEYDQLVFSNNDKEIIADNEVIDLSNLEQEGFRKITFGEDSFIIRLIEIPEGTDIQTLHIPRNKYTKWFDYDKINKRLTLRTRSEDDYIIFDTDGHKKMVSRVMIDCKIPVRLRNSIPLFSMGEEIIWIVGYRDSAGYRVDDDTKRVIEVSIVED